MHGLARRGVISGGGYGHLVGTPTESSTALGGGGHLIYFWLF